MTKAITLIETLFSLIILSIVLITSANLNIVLYKQNKLSNELLLAKLDFETSRLFLEKSLNKDKHFDNLKLDNKKILYKDDIFLTNISKFTKSINNNILDLNICIQKNFEFCQNIKINVNSH